MLCLERPSNEVLSRLPEVDDGDYNSWKAFDQHMVSMRLLADALEREGY